MGWDPLVQPKGAKTVATTGRPAASVGARNDFNELLPHGTGMARTREPGAEEEKVLIINSTLPEKAKRRIPAIKLGNLAPR